MNHKGFTILYSSLYPQSYLQRVISNFRKQGFANWRFVFYDMRQGEKQYYLCTKA